MSACTRESHEAVKAQPAKWRALKICAANWEGLELRQCPHCDSTLAREIETEAVNVSP